MRRIVKLGGLAALVLAVASPGWAEAPGEAPHVEDGCGDTDLWAEFEGERVEADAQRPDRVDIDAAWFADTDDGVAVTLQVCGDIGDPGVTGASYLVSWELGDGCFGRVVVGTMWELPDNRGWDGAYTRQCRGPVIEPVVYGADVHYSLRLGDRVSVEGRRVVWEIPVDLLAEEEASWFTEGTLWATPTVFVQEAQGWYGSTQNERYAYNLGVWSDSAGPGRDFTVGEGR